MRLLAAASCMAAAALLLRPPAPQPVPIWEDLIRPFAPGQPVVGGYVLSPPRRGEEHDVIFTARREATGQRPARRVEVHVVKRGQWKDAVETRSFAVAWEAPPPGSLVSAPEEDARAVTRALAEAISRNDGGFESVDAVPLQRSAEPAVGRLLARTSGVRGWLIGALACAALLLVGSIPGGTPVAAALVLALGLALRLPSLAVPFVHDQDVQRMLTGNSSLREIATGVGLRDRHPPLYFFVLHAAQRFGQSEALGRAPAVVAGALAAPAILLLAAGLGRAGLAALIAAFAVAVSPQWVARSREVSEIPLYALLLLACAGSLPWALRGGGRTSRSVLALSHGLALYTYYLAPFVVLAHAAVLLLVRAERRVLRAFALGVAVGLPALVLGVSAFVRDWSARATARVFPALAWGEHSPREMIEQMAVLLREGFGAPLLGLIALGGAVALLRRDLPALVALLGVVVTAAAIALLSPFARVQAYYVCSVLPLAALMVALLLPPGGEAVRVLWSAVLVLAVAAGLVPRLAGMRSLYVPDEDAFMPRFAALVAERPEDAVVTVAHYDKTLLAYYLARRGGREIAWGNVDQAGGRRIEPLLLVHGIDAGSQAEALGRLEEILRAGRALVIERDGFLLPAITQRLSACELLARAPSARLVRCG